MIEEEIVGVTTEGQTIIRRNLQKACDEIVENLRIKHLLEQTPAQDYMELFL